MWYIYRGSNTFLFSCLSLQSDDDVDNKDKKNRKPAEGSDDSATGANASDTVAAASEETPQ